jgi:hypothetical protein
MMNGGKIGMVGLLRLRLLMSRLKALGLRPGGSNGDICGILT